MGYIYDESVYLRFVLWLLRISQIPELARKQSNNERSQGMLYTGLAAPIMLRRSRRGLTYIHPAWASALLLVFGKSGNARAFSSGTSNRDLTPALFLYVDATYSIAIVSLGESEASIIHL